MMRGGSGAGAVTMDRVQAANGPDELGLDEIAGGGWAPSMAGVGARERGYTATMRRHRFLLAATSLVAVAGMVACSDEDRDDLADTASSVVDDAGDVVSSAAEDVEDAAGEAVDDTAEAAVRNIAAQAGASAFDDAGSPIDGELTCETDASDGAAAIAVSCTGTTTDGAAAAMTGTTSETPGASVTEIKGEFVGTVDGTEAFRVDSLGG